MNTRYRINKIGFGGGCHWCTEAVFQALAGIDKVEQGFIQSTPPHESFSEAVIAHFDPSVIPLNVLVEIHLRTHASSSDHTMRGKYRSAVYCFSDEQQNEVHALLANLSKTFDDPIVTQALPFELFKQSDVRFHNYHATNPERPFCKAYIDPKLRLLRKEYSEQLTGSERKISSER